MPSSYPNQAKLFERSIDSHVSWPRAVYLYHFNKEKYFDPTIANSNHLHKGKPREQQQESSMIKITNLQTPEPLSLRNSTMSSQTQTLPSKHKRFDSLVSSPAISTEAQWSLVHSRLQHPDHGHSQYSDTNWLSTIDTAILLLALVKQKAESDLLREELEHALLFSDLEVDNPFPNYDVGTHRGSHPPPSEASSQAASARTRSSHDSNTELLPSGGHTSTSPSSVPDLESLSPLSPTFGGRRGSLLVGTVNRRRDTESVPLSPLSPTFGVRKGNVLAGTVNRRRSNPPLFSLSPVLLPSHSTRPRSKSVSVVQERRDWAQRDRENRVQFEAAWIYIESHLDEYVLKFGFDGEGAGREEWRKEDVWMELVRLRDRGSTVEASAERAAYTKEQI